MTAVAVAGEGGGVGRAHYLRQLVFGPAGPHATAPARHAHGTGDAPLAVPAIPRDAASRRP